MRPVSASRGQQRGWVGLVALLIALAIVAWLGRTALMQYGLLGPSAVQAPAERVLGGVGPATPDASTAAPSVQVPIERARSLEGTLQQQADERAKAIDAGAR